MTNLMLKNLDGQSLESVLLLSLDESYFFNTLSKFFQERMQCDQVVIYRFNDDGQSHLVSKNGLTLNNSFILEKGLGASGYIYRSKRGYFSNSVERDPVFTLEAKEGIKAELAIPVISDGYILASIHCQMFSQDKEFQKQDVTDSLEILNAVKHAIQNMKMYLQAKLMNEALLKTIELKERELQDQRFGVKSLEAYKIIEKDIVGRSAPMKDLLNLVDKISDKDLSAFIQGETGTGKEMIARRIHCRSSRRDRAFIAIDCTVYNEKQLEVELFGDARSAGALENAHFGTLFLNNIDVLSIHMQNKLLQVLLHKTGIKADSRDYFKTDIRLVTSSHKDLLEMVRNLQFKDELFYAISNVILKVPSLRDRKEDIEVLANFFLNQRKNKSEQKAFSPSAVKSMNEYVWPGNVRELQNVVERAAVMSEGMMIEKHHLDHHIANAEKEILQEKAPVRKVQHFVQVTLEELEKTHILATLENLNGNKTKSAKVLGITVKTLYNKLHSYGIEFDKDA